MASRRSLEREDTRLRVLRLISEDPKVSTRGIASALRISHGSAYYVLSALVEKGLVKLGNFAHNPKKGQYVYLLTPRGVREKTILTKSFIVRKRAEYEEMKNEIEILERELKVDKDV